MNADCYVLSIERNEVRMNFHCGTGMHAFRAKHRSHLAVDAVELLEVLAALHLHALRNVVCLHSRLFSHLNLLAARRGSRGQLLFSTVLFYSACTLTV